MPTYVYIQNGLPTTLTVDTSVAPPLKGSYWSDPSSPVDAPSGQQTEILWMDRDIGITDGDTWVFTSAMEVGGTSVLLQEQVTGTALSSTIAIQIAAGDQDTGWQTEGAQLQFTAADGNGYQANGQFVPASDYDNVIYTILPY